jgi:dTDP-4-dehydrorhamnose reductase
VPQAALESLVADPCPPDIVGINHYLSSERFLDERLERYAGVGPTDNGKDQYADVEALRVADPTGVSGLENLLREAWERYRLPVAVTEVHNGSTREEQLRWLAEAWDAARRLRGEGVDIRAVTAWALLGSYDWDSLLTRRAGHYEPGLFDVRGGGRPRPTALARMVRDLARSGEADHPTLDAPGWWHREERFFWGPPTQCCPTSMPRRGRAPFLERRPSRPVLVAGGDGALARTVAEFCAARGLPHRLATRRELDVADAASVAAALDAHRPWAVVNAAGFARVDGAEAEPERCRRDNVEGARTLGAACAAAGLPLLSFSSHLVFDGAKAEPYLEDDAAAPLSVYGATKAEADRTLLAVYPDALVVAQARSSAPGRARRRGAAVRAVAGGRSFAAADDVTVSPTYLPDLVHAALDLFLDREAGVWHLASAGSVTWADFAREVVRAAGLDVMRVRAVRARRSAGRPAGRGRACSVPAAVRSCARSTTRSRATPTRAAAPAGGTKPGRGRPTLPAAPARAGRLPPPRAPACAPHPRRRSAPAACRR